MDIIEVVNREEFGISLAQPKDDWFPDLETERKKSAIYQLVLSSNTHGIGCVTLKLSSKSANQIR